MNNVIIIGNLTKDLELRKTQQNNSVVNFTVAINEGQDTDYIDCVAWNKLADNLVKYCGKGSKIAVNGKIKTRTYDKNDGSRVKVTEVLAFNVEFLNTKKENSQSNYEPTNDGYFAQQGNFGELQIDPSDLPF